MLDLGDILQNKFSYLEDHSRVEETFMKRFLIFAKCCNIRIAEREACDEP
jgi:hypothetical protein